MIPPPPPPPFELCCEVIIMTCPCHSAFFDLNGDVLEGVVLSEDPTHLLLAKNTKTGTASDKRFAGLQSENESEWSSESGDQDTCVLSVINLGTEAREDWIMGTCSKT